LESARILLNHGDPEGAVNRAYYSAFDAAHYALLSENIEYDPAQTRTHNGLITVFSLQLVKTGLIAKEIGRDLNRLQQLRQLADYTGESIDDASAMTAIESVERIHRALFGTSY
jgi:uncharacterized protein (UPF0332 family)